MMQRGGISLLLFAGAAIAAIVIVVFAMAGINKAPAPSLTPADTKTQQLMEQGESDEATSIEQDLEATEFTNLDAELSDIDKELNQ